MCKGSLTKFANLLCWLCLFYMEPSKCNTYAETEAELLDCLEYTVLQFACSRDDQQALRRAIVGINDETGALEPGLVEISDFARLCYEAIKHRNADNEKILAEALRANKLIAPAHEMSTAPSTMELIITSYIATLFNEDGRQRYYVGFHIAGMCLYDFHLEIMPKYIAENAVFAMFSKMPKGETNRGNLLLAEDSGRLASLNASAKDNTSIMTAWTETFYFTCTLDKRYVEKCELEAVRERYATGGPKGRGINTFAPKTPNILNGKLMALFDVLDTYVFDENYIAEYCSAKARCEYTYDELHHQWASIHARNFDRKPKTGNSAKSSDKPAKQPEKVISKTPVLPAVRIRRAEGK